MVTEPAGHPPLVQNHQSGGMHAIWKPVLAGGEGGGAKL